jgi:hypothetical protein
MRLLSSDKDRTTASGDPVPEWLYGLLMEAVARGFVKEQALARFNNIAWQEGTPEKDYRAHFFRIDPAIGDGLYVFKNAQENGQHVAILDTLTAAKRGLIALPAAVERAATEPASEARIREASQRGEDIRNAELAKTVREYEKRLGDAIKLARAGGLRVDVVGMGTSPFPSLGMAIRIDITEETVIKRTY